MLHLYINEGPHGDSFIITDKEQLHHLTVVLRARRGDDITLFDLKGTEYRGRIIDFTKNSTTVQIESRHPAPSSTHSLTIACAIPKGSDMDGIVDKLTQLGVDIIIPMLTERVVARPDDGSKKIERWRKIALSAAEQSGRNMLPDIPGILLMEDVLKRTQNERLKLIPTLVGQTRPFREVLNNEVSLDAAILIGPEGDFTPAEVKRAIEAGYVPVSLGKNVLRVDTAAAAVAALIRLLGEP